MIHRRVLPPSPRRITQPFSGAWSHVKPWRLNDAGGDAEDDDDDDMSLQSVLAFGVGLTSASRHLLGRAFRRRSSRASNQACYSGSRDSGMRPISPRR